jgi:hypothetical protein
MGYTLQQRIDAVRSHLAHRNTRILRRQHGIWEVYDYSTGSLVLPYVPTEVADALSRSLPAYQVLA